MPQKLVLLAGAADVALLVAHFERLDPPCPIRGVSTVEDLAAELRDGPPSRLISFCTNVIVPRSLLDLTDGPAYNIHPGPPSFPGRHPECWGAYYGAPRFGATLHVMLPLVDEGAIIDTRWFDTAVNADRRSIGLKAFSAAVRLLYDWSLAFMTIDRPLRPNGERWSGRKWRRSDLELLSRIEADIDAEELERRKRALAALQDYPLSINVHGHSFTYPVASTTVLDVADIIMAAS